MYDLEILACELESTAQWRRQKAMSFTDDRRNLDAADLLDRLAEEVRTLRGSLLHAKLSRVLDRHFDPSAVEEECEYRKSIGFRSEPISGDRYLRRIIEIYEDRSNTPPVSRWVSRWC